MEINVTYNPEEEKKYENDLSGFLDRNSGKELIRKEITERIHNNDMSVTQFRKIFFDCADVEDFKVYVDTLNELNILVKPLTNISNG